MLFLKGYLKNSIHSLCKCMAVPYHILCVILKHYSICNTLYAGGTIRQVSSRTRGFHESSQNREVPNSTIPASPINASSTLLFFNQEKHSNSPTAHFPYSFVLYIIPVNQTNSTFSIQDPSVSYYPEDNNHRNTSNTYHVPINNTYIPNHPTASYLEDSRVTNILSDTNPPHPITLSPKIHHINQDTSLSPKSNDPTLSSCIPLSTSSNSPSLRSSQSPTNLLVNDHLMLTRAKKSKF